MQKKRQAKVVNLAAYRNRSPQRIIAAFAGRNADFRLYLLAMRTWLAWERAGSSRAVIHTEAKCLRHRKPEIVRRPPIALAKERRNGYGFRTMGVK